jgi:hypothetical protein
VPNPGLSAAVCKQSFIQDGGRCNWSRVESEDDEESEGHSDAEDSDEADNETSGEDEEADERAEMLPIGSRTPGYLSPQVYGRRMRSSA